MHRVVCGVGGWVVLASSLGPADDARVVACRPTVTCTALEPHYLADATPLAARDWLVIDAAIDVVGWDQRSVTAIVGASIAPVRLWGAR